MDIKLNPKAQPIQDLLSLTKYQFAAGDFDAEHPLYLQLIKTHKIDYERGLWLSFLYMAFYDEASAWVVFNNSDPFTVPKNVKFPIGMNRRNLLGTSIITHFSSLQTQRKIAKEWPTHNFEDKRFENWRRLRETIGAVWGNGRFGTYTTAEMLHKVNGVDVAVTDFDNKNSSGPADGIKRATGCGTTLAELDDAAEKLYWLVHRTRMKPFYTSVDRGVVESILCNYSGICRGRYYSGRNLDRQQGKILAVEKIIGKELTDLWNARKLVYKRSYLGEFAGWVGINKPRLKHFLNTKVILCPDDER